MDDVLASVQDIFEGQIDFHGQHMAEILSTALLILSGVVAFLAGYIYRDLHLTLWVGLAGTLVTGLAVIPPWPVYNKSPEKWLVSSAGRVGGARVMVDGTKVA
ncbi:putative microsomal signal peptidase subunit SPC12 [Aspergillus pseudotamarii]|uniref:Signal peptidase complex subunit 1 n=1 Tax=Aspergillus pseudotamarii TaxID=132259 RepID=A0A5N6SET0_ASPPS|nr:putative microsomal signal peptidase subunit SPC12 [Aspergillus pseudotamarii]KAE8132210.1 putative microsomal signal peptidase subunit SPC12 [Aspergillus pseudotamarii]